MPDHSEAAEQAQKSQQPPQWMADLSEREQSQILHARDYARNWSNAGIPGHGQLLVIAILAQKLDDAERGQGPGFSGR